MRKPHVKINCCFGNERRINTPLLVKALEFQPVSYSHCTEIGPREVRGMKEQWDQYRNVPTGLRQRNEWDPLFPGPCACPGLAPVQCDWTITLSNFVLNLSPLTWVVRWFFRWTCSRVPLPSKREWTSRSGCIPDLPMYICQAEDIRVFHKYTKLTMLALLPTLYFHSSFLY